MEATRSSEMSVLHEPHGVTFQKTPFFIVTAVKSSNLTKINWMGSVARRNVFPVWYELRFYIPETAFFIVTAAKSSNVTKRAYPCSKSWRPRRL
jgi:hypothetical protein